MRGKGYIFAAAAALLMLVPVQGQARSRYFRALQDSIAAKAATMLQDSIPSAAADSTLALPDSAALDSIRRSRLYDSLDTWFWSEADTVTMPDFDSTFTAYYDSIARRLPDTTDIKRAIKRNKKELRDSLKAAKPRVLETFAIPDSLYFRRIISWNADTKFNELHMVEEMDTTYNANFYDYPMLKKDISATYLGPVGSATLYHNYFKREEVEDAPMFTPYTGDTYTPDNLPQYNTKTPHTELAYWGTLFAPKAMEESNLKLMSTQNFSPEFNLTLLYTRLGSRGMLKNENTSHRNTAIYGNYMGKRYLVNAGTIRQTIDRTENGGLRDSFWIRDTLIDPQAIEVNLAKAANILKRRTYFIDQTLAIPLNFLRKDRDSLELGGGTMAHIGHYGEYTTYTKEYTDEIGINDEWGRNFYFNKFNINALTSDDEMEVRNLNNRFFIKLQPFAPDAVVSKINAGIGYQILSHYSFDPSDYLYGKKFQSEHNLYLYGGVSGMFKKYFQWDADADYYYAGYRMFDFDINGHVKVSLYPFDQGIHLEGRFSSKLKTPHPFEQHIYTNHHLWNNDFGKTSTTRVECTLTIPKSGTKAFFGYALTANTLYYDTLSVIRQHPDPVSIMSAYLQQNFHLWAFHFDNQVLFQLSSNQEVLPLPKLTLNLRWYLEFDVVKEAMRMQIGLNAIANTKFYAPAYSPDLGQFYNQTSEMIGQVPYFDAFVNVQWKRASIFVKYTNAFKDWPESDYFSAYHYIKPVRGFKIGIHWPFYTW